MESPAFRCGPFMLVTYTLELVWCVSRDCGVERLSRQLLQREKTPLQSHARPARTIGTPHMAAEQSACDRGKRLGATCIFRSCIVHMRQLVRQTLCQLSLVRINGLISSISRHINLAYHLLQCKRERFLQLLIYARRWIRRIASRRRSRRDRLHKR